MNESEWQTRKQRIDARLLATRPPWQIILYHDDLDLSALACHAVEDLPPANGPPVFRYTVEQAILDGYLVDYEPVAIKSRVRMNGVFLKEGETVERMDTETGQKALDQLEDERQFDAADVERSITAPDSNRKIIEEVAKYAYEHEAVTGHFPKILIFAVHDLPHRSHADQLVKTCRDVFKQGDDFVQKITGNANVDRDYHIKVLAKRLLRIDKDMNAEARTQFAAWIPEGDVCRFAREVPQRLKQDFTGTMRLLRNPDFQKLLLEYPRAKSTFITALEPKDSVTSQKLERYGKFDNAEDYLDAFAAFVKANADKVTALSVLLQHPKDWRPAVLEELRRTMAQQGFNEEKLQQVDRATGFKALANLISMVKHAATMQAPLLTAEDRVNRAIDQFLKTRELTPEQMQWLSLVREHLVKNLSMDEEDFDLTPLLEMRGGRAKARKVFPDLPRIVAELNEAIAD